MIIVKVHYFFICVIYVSNVSIGYGSFAYVDAIDIE